MLEHFPKIDHLRVQFSDVDMLRHVNNLTYLRWAETARTEYFAEVLGGQNGTAEGIILAKLEISFERQMAFREHVALGTRLHRIGTKSFQLEHEIWSTDHDHRCAHILATLVAFNYELNKTIEVPDLWRKRIAAFEATPATP
jgi:acyl-CoA thioester hydrolase